MRWVSLAVALALAVGCRKNVAPTETGGDSPGPAPGVKAPDATPLSPARDFAEYVAEIRSTVPVRVDEFKEKGLKCEPYVTSKLAGIEIFDSLTLTIEPVVLKDGLTGKTQRYVGVRMVRANGGDVFATGSSPAAAKSRENGMLPITWDSVVMVPERK